MLVWGRGLWHPGSASVLGRSSVSFRNGAFSYFCFCSQWQPNSVSYPWLVWGGQIFLSSPPAEQTFAWIFSPRQFPTSPLWVEGFCLFSPQEAIGFQVFKKDKEVFTPHPEADEFCFYSSPWSKTLLPLPQWLKAVAYWRKGLEAAKVFCLPPAAALINYLLVPPRRDALSHFLPCSHFFSWTSGDLWKKVCLWVETPCVWNGLQPL